MVKFYSKRPTRVKSQRVLAVDRTVPPPAPLHAVAACLPVSRRTEAHLHAAEERAAEAEAARARAEERAAEADVARARAEEQAANAKAEAEHEKAERAAELEQLKAAEERAAEAEVVRARQAGEAAALALIAISFA